MDLRKTYAGPGLRSGSDPFSQMGKDIRQERDDRARQDLNGGSRVNRPTQSSIAKGVGDNRGHRNALSARTSGRYSAFSQSVDLGPALRSTGHTGKSNIPRQPVQQGQTQQTPPSSPPPQSAIATEQDLRLKMQDLIDAGEQREALLMEQKRHLEASLHTTNLRCAELARGLQQASAALDAERAAAARLRTERDEHAAELDRARSQAAELQVSGSVALTTSEVCRAALSSAFKGTVCAIGSAHEELESALAAQQQQQLELEVLRARMEELEDLAYQRGEELEAARTDRRLLSEAMEELAERLQSREDELDFLVSLLTPTGAESGGNNTDRAYQAAVAQAEILTKRVRQLEQQLTGQLSDLETLRSQVAGYQDEMARLQQQLKCSNNASTAAVTSITANSSISSCCEAQEPVRLEAKMTELANQRGQLEMDNLQLAAENEQLRHNVSAMREQLEEALVTAAVFTAASDRDISATEEIIRLQQQLAAAVGRAEEFHAEAEAARADAKAAELRAEKSAELLLVFTSQAEAARAQADAARGALEAARVEGRKLRGELEALRAREAEARTEAEQARAKVERARAKMAKAEAAKAAEVKALSELKVIRERASLEAEQARTEGEERARVAEREQIKVLEERAAIQATRVQELAVEAAQLRNRVSELQEQISADRRTSKEALAQLNTMHANEDVLMQRILAGEAERKQLLRQLDEGNGALSVMRSRLDEAAQQAAEIVELRVRVADLTAEAERQAEAAAVAGARVPALEAELQELRATLRATAELASQEARVGERREAQLACLRQQVAEAEEQQHQSEAELRVLKAQVSVNERLRAQVDDLQSRLALAEAEAAVVVSTHKAKRPLVDACTQVEGSDTAASDAAIEDSTHGQGFLGGGSPGILLSPIECLGSPLRGPATVNPSPRSTAQMQALAHAAARQSLVLGWLGSTSIGGSAAGAPGGVQLFATEHMVPENLLASYNTIPEEEPGECDGTPDIASRRYGKRLSPPARQQQARQVRPLRLVLEMVIKGTLVAGGMALGLALGKPQAVQALTSSRGGDRGNTGDDGPAEVVEEDCALP